MKIAVCFSGLGEGRQIKKPHYEADTTKYYDRVEADIEILTGWESIKKHVYTAKEEHTYDTFFHVWVKNQKRVDQLCRVLNPTDYSADTEVESRPGFEPWPGAVAEQSHIHRMCSQIESRARAVQLALDWGEKHRVEYDMIVVLRYDLWFKRFADYNKIKPDVEKGLLLSSGRLACSHERPSWADRIYDFFWIASPGIMRKTLAQMADWDDLSNRNLIKIHRCVHYFYEVWFKLNGVDHKSILCLGEDLRLCRDMHPNERPRSLFMDDTNDRLIRSEEIQRENIKRAEERHIEKAAKELLDRSREDYKRMLDRQRLDETPTDQTDAAESMLHRTGRRRSGLQS